MRCAGATCRNQPDGWRWLKGADVAQPEGEDRNEDG